MSIFGFIKEIFFYRTEKSGTNKHIYCCIENGKETIVGFKRFFETF